MAQQISREEWERKYGRGRLERPQPVNIPGLPDADAIVPELLGAQVPLPRRYETFAAGTYLSDGSVDANGRPVVVGRRPDSRLAARDRIARNTDPWPSTERPGPAREAERAAAAAEALLQRALGNRSGLIRDADVDLLDAVASQLLGEEPVGSAAKDLGANANDRYGAFTSEDPTQESTVSRPSPDINPFGLLEVPARVQRPGSPGGTWGVAVGPNLFRPSVARIDPTDIVATETMNPRRNREGFTGDSDNTASFQRERQISLGEAAQEIMEATKTPVITLSGLEAARVAGRARAATPEERDGNLVGYVQPPGSSVEVPVYAVTDREGRRLTTVVEKPDPSNPLYGVIKVQEPYFRVGSPINRDDETLRELAAPLFGMDEARQFGPAPLLADYSERIKAERRFGGPGLEAFMQDVAQGAFMSAPDEVDAMRSILAPAAATGALRGKGGQKRAIPGTVASLYSGINPKTPRNPEGSDEPIAVAAKQLRAFLQEAPRPLSPREGVEVAAQIGARWGVSATEVLRAAGEFEAGRAKNDPGRPLFAPGSNANALLQQAVAEIRGGREVDLFAETPLAPLEGGLGGADRGENAILGLLQQLNRGDEGVDLPDAVGQAFGQERLEDLEVSGELTGASRGRLEGARDPKSGISIVEAPVELNDPLIKAAVALTGDPDQGAYLAEVARRSAAPTATSPSRSPLATLLELAGYRTPVEVTPGAQQVRRQRQGDFASVNARGAAVLGQRGYGAMADALGSEPGSAAQERAMQLLTERLVANQEASSEPSMDDLAQQYRESKVAQHSKSGHGPRGRYTAGAGRADFLGLGSSPGSWMHDRAMQLIVERAAARQAADQMKGQVVQEQSSTAPLSAATNTVEHSMLNAPASPGTDPEALQRQASIERLQRRRRGYVGGLQDRVLGTFGVAS